MDARSLPNEVLSATVIVCEFLSVEFEGSSRRYNVTFKSLAKGAKSESARTDRIDDARRGVVVTMLAKSVLTPGSKCRLYKVVQAAGEDRKVRVVWAERL